MHSTVSKRYIINGFKVTRSYSSYTKNGIPAAVNLSFNVYSSRPSQESPVLICHGLFDSKYSWTSIARDMSDRLSRDIYTVDLRNHGDSPHTTEHTYAAMTEDIKLFIEKHQLKQPILLGHSMGGKLVMNTALKYPHLASRLAVVDMPPVRTEVPRNFVDHIDAMKAIEDANVLERSKAEEILAYYEPKERIRTYLLQNLKCKPNGVWHFPLPYDIIGKSLNFIFDFPIHNENTCYYGPTLFIGGENSILLPPFYKHEKRIKQMFPNYDLQIVDGVGHYIHQRKPAALVNILSSFMMKPLVPEADLSENPYIAFI